MQFYEREPGPAGELKAQRLQDTLISICENQKDRFAILDIPQSKDIEWVRRWRRRTDSLVLRVLLAVAAGARRGRASCAIVPPSGFLAGCYARRDLEGVHHAPANLEIEAAEDVSLRVTEDHIGLLNADAVNTFRLQRGVRPWGARTASSDPQWRYIPVRRLFIMLRRSLEAGFAWIDVRAEQPEDLGSRPGSRTVAFLSNLYSRGCWPEGMPSEAFFVKCDAETNPPEQVDNGLLDLRHRRRTRGSRRVHHDLADPDDDRYRRSSDAVGASTMPRQPQRSAARILLQGRSSSPACDRRCVLQERQRPQVRDRGRAGPRGRPNDTTYQLVGATKWSNIVLKQGFTRTPRCSSGARSGSNARR